MKGKKEMKVNDRIMLYGSAKKLNEDARVKYITDKAVLFISDRATYLREYEREIWIPISILDRAETRQLGEGSPEEYFLPFWFYPSIIETQIS